MYCMQVLHEIDKGDCMCLSQQQDMAGTVDIRESITVHAQDILGLCQRNTVVA